MSLFSCLNSFSIRTLSDEGTVIIPWFKLLGIFLPTGSITGEEASGTPEYLGEGCLSSITDE